MNLYIRISNGQPVDHPIMEDNFIQAFPEIDINNLPSNFAKFVRKPMPSIGVYEMYEGVTYEPENDGYADFHQVRTMTTEEKTNKQNQVKQEWTDFNGFASWVFDEDTCAFHAPTPMPVDDKFYDWNEETLSWVEIQPE